MQPIMRNQVSEVLVEARLLIAEGDWARGQDKVIRRREGGRGLYFGFDEVVEVVEVPCYCVRGAVREAAGVLAGAQKRAGEAGRQKTNVPQTALAMAFEALSETSATRGLKYDPESVIVFVNDHLLDNKEQALGWFDRAIEWVRVTSR